VKAEARCDEGEEYDNRFHGLEQLKDEVNQKYETISQILFARPQICVPPGCRGRLRLGDGRRRKPLQYLEKLPPFFEERLTIRVGGCTDEKTCHDAIRKTAAIKDFLRHAAIASNRHGGTP
jgi:hypothetical protein